MDKARAAISNFTSKHGHTTDVEEQVRPAVTSEQIKPHRHEEVTQAVDREVHQHHHHTTVQPLQHREVLPEVHQHNMVPVENREFRHENEGETRQRLERDAAQFKDTSITHQTHVTQAAAPTVVGEHVHHHVHETVQPIVHKETIKPEVVHTTVPIHETHHSSSKHHGMSTLPMKTLDEFTTAGGALTGGRSVTHEHYEGQPRPYNKDLQTRIEDVLPGHHGQRGTDSGIGGGVGSGMNTTSGEYDERSGLGNTGGVGHTNKFTGSSTAGPHNSNLENKLDPRVDSNMDGRSGLGNTTGVGHQNQFTGSSTAGPHNSNMENKLDPRVDSNMDGRSGLGNTGSTNYGSNTGHGNTSGNTGTGYSNTGSGMTGRDNLDNTTGTTTKPSMMDRLNPFKDTDRA